MEEFQIFLAKNYIWLIILDIFFIFAFVGYKVDMKNKKELEKNEELETFGGDIEEKQIEEIKAKMGEKANASLQSAVKQEIGNVKEQEEVEKL